MLHVRERLGGDQAGHPGRDREDSDRDGGRVESTYTAEDGRGLLIRLQTPVWDSDYVSSAMAASY